MIINCHVDKIKSKFTHLNRGHFGIATPESSSCQWRHDERLYIQLYTYNKSLVYQFLPLYPQYIIVYPIVSLF
jgi:aspartyl/asparaginyl beta-hydroxylase (cupin superfamily)